MRNFSIAQPQSLKQASSLLSTSEEKTYLMAGGIDLLDEMKSKIVTPDIVVDLKSIPSLTYIISVRDLAAGITVIPKLSVEKREEAAVLHPEGKTNTMPFSAEASVTLYILPT